MGYNEWVKCPNCSQSMSDYDYQDHKCKESATCKNDFKNKQKTDKKHLNKEVNG